MIWTAIGAMAVKQLALAKTKESKPIEVESVPGEAGNSRKIILFDCKSNNVCNIIEQMPFPARLDVRRGSIDARE